MRKNSATKRSKILEVLDNLLQSKSNVVVESWCKENHLSAKDFEEILDIFNSLRLNYEVFKKGEITYLKPPSPDSLINISFQEWVTIALEKKPAHQKPSQTLYEKLEVNNPHKHQSLLDSFIDEEEVIHYSPQHREDIIKLIENGIQKKQVLKMELQSNTELIQPRKILYLEGDISIIGECMKDGHLQNIHLTELKEVRRTRKKYNSMYTMYEVEEFINSIRSMNENAIRLVLKIYSRDNFSLNFNHIYFDNPCLFSNANGDFIWAATLEPNKEVFEWLCELGPAVEIMDPSSFKRDFIKYCESKLKKLA